ncbi:DUF502 domain-containing protein [Pseudorhodoferax sp. Leaf274]|uniref:DUF502 domain-containing protein n=1 Tax=Pseudorhodoferax sp. Leaf274 TaxID=1736318 RepID=UPI00070309F7|nr:DUF502 domain-containing protein [Pseudorhodoferax sp. Leaf274]KQP37034.1 hypothetical protein ASF44_15000 [Pseudorhodoferax sp. Leaf274]
MLARLQAQSKHLARPFLTGLLAILPLAATLTLLGWFWQLLAAWFGPSSLFGSVLVAIGFSVTRSESIGYVLGLLLLCVAIYALGLLVQAGLQRGLQRIVDRLVTRIPLVRNIYDLVKRMVDLFSRRGGEGLGSMSPVWLHFGGRPAEGAAGSDAQKVAVLALLCTPEPVVMDGGRRYLGVLVPTAPVPVGGGLLYVPEDWVSRADIGIEGLTSIYVSMGLTTNQYMGARPAANPPGTAPVKPA